MNFCSSKEKPSRSASLRERVEDPLLPVDQGAVAVGGHPLDVFELREGHERRGIMHGRIGCRAPRRDPWTYSNTRASSCSPKHGVPVPEGRHAATVDDAVAAANEIGYPCVVKAQVAIGKRGKAGGIKVAKDEAEARQHSEAILGMDIRGFTVHDLWIESASEIAAEYYASIILDRSEKKLLAMLSRMGGMDVEEVAEPTPRRSSSATSSPATEFDADARPRDRASTPGSTRTSPTRSPRCWSSSPRSRSPRTRP